MAEGATVDESAILQDRLTGESREVDVVIRGVIAGHTVTVSVEVSSRTRRATVEWVEQMVAKHEHLETSRLVLASRAGFTRQAKVRAEASNVIAVEQSDLADDAGRSFLMRQLIPPTLVPRNITYTVAGARVWVFDSSGTVVSFLAKHDEPVFLKDGTQLGSLGHLLLHCVDEDSAGIANHYRAVAVPHGFIGDFRLLVDPVPGAGYEGGVFEHHYVRLNEPRTELAPLRMLLIYGEYLVEHVDREPVRYQRIGEIGYAYSEQKTSDESSLLLWTETADNVGHAYARRLSVGGPPEGQTFPWMISAYDPDRPERVKGWALIGTPSQGRASRVKFTELVDDAGAGRGQLAPEFLEAWTKSRAER